MAGAKKNPGGATPPSSKENNFYLLFISINYQEPFTIHGPRLKQCYVSGNKSINYTHQILYTSANGVIQGIGDYLTYIPCSWKWMTNTEKRTRLL